MEMVPSARLLVGQAVLLQLSHQPPRHQRLHHQSRAVLLVLRVEWASPVQQVPTWRLLLLRVVLPQAQVQALLQASHRPHQAQLLARLQQSTQRYQEPQAPEQRLVQLQALPPPQRSHQDPPQQFHQSQALSPFQLPQVPAQQPQSQAMPQQLAQRSSLLLEAPPLLRLLEQLRLLLLQLRRLRLLPQSIAARLL